MTLHLRYPLTNAAFPAGATLAGVAARAVGRVGSQAALSHATISS